MEYLYEAIVHQNDLPIKIFTHTLDQYPYHWHEDTELLLILSGACEMRIGNEQVVLNEDDLFVINKNEVHYTKSTRQDVLTQILVLQFDLSHFQNVIAVSSTKRFKIPIVNIPHDEPIKNQIKTIMAQLMFSVLEHEDGYRFEVEIYMLRLLSLLTKFSFEIENSEGVVKEQDDQRLLGILKYIDVHYVDADLSLNQISDVFYMNPQYLSRYFKSKIGLSLKKYIDNLRLNKSLLTLQMTGDRIIDIALKFGFPDAKAYYRVFKELIGGTPQKYREKHKLDSDSIQPMDYFNINSRETFVKLNHYLEQNKANIILEPKRETIIKDFSLDLAECVPHKNERTAQRLMTFGYAGHGLRPDFGKQLRTIQREIGFEYIRFHGIFTDEFGLCRRSAEGQLTFHFEKIDLLFDLLLDNNVKPFLELGFMPSVLASDEKHLFLWYANLSEPKDIKEWEALIDAFVRHLINRYGLEEVSKWYFEFWNEPEIIGVFWHGTNNAFFNFYKSTYQVIKSISPKLKIGGFGNMFFSESGGWLEEFTKFAEINEIFIDFYTFHIYNFNVSNKVFIDKFLKELSVRFDPLEFEKLIAAQLNQIELGDAAHMQREIKSILSKVQSLPFKNCTDKEFWITEWNTNPNGRELIRDTAYAGAFVVKTVLENDGLVNGMGYWTFTDIFEELFKPDSLFHGGFGLLTTNGLKKPVYHAMQFINALGDEIVLDEAEIRVTKTGDQYQILTHNYCHYNDLYASMDFSQLTYHKRDGVFGKVANKLVRLQVSGLVGRFKMETQFVNAEAGSVFDNWVRIGAPESLSEDAYQYLMANSDPGYMYKELILKMNSVIEIELQPHEIRLIKLSPIY